jgi:FkbM family methyltransferase
VAAVKVTRGASTFEVVDDPQTASWGFWQNHFATGKWESFTLQTIDAFTGPDTTYVDIGAWVGPTVLWAARNGGKVVAVEPDPIARSALHTNAALNCDNVTIIPAALSATTGTATLTTRGTWGDSMSTLQPGDGESIEVDTISPADLFAGLENVSLVKIDIEGGEAVAFPAAANLLHDLGCPIILSLHLDWIDDPEPLLAVMDNFDQAILDDSQHAFRTVLLR